MSQTFEPAFLPPPDPNRAALRRLHNGRRPWIVCCYAPVGAVYRPHENRWQIPAPHHGAYYTRWSMIDFKTFHSRTDAVTSRSYERCYAPFDNPHCLVLLRFNRTIQYEKMFVTVPLYSG